MEDDELTKEELELEEEFKMNYIICMSDYIARNIVSIYVYYQNNYEMSLNNIIRTSKDHFVLDDKEKELLNRGTKQKLKEQYKFKIVSENDENLKLIEI